ncbi:MAG TPA: hypothetical protein DD706_01530 [Nitrospiraceae bacterium]|nr:hypothetical protein [Nitrospiraceae bacterium]
MSDNRRAILSEGSFAVKTGNLGGNISPSELKKLQPLHFRHQVEEGNGPFSIRGIQPGIAIHFNKTFQYSSEVGLIKHQNKGSRFCRRMKGGQ